MKKLINTVPGWIILDSKTNEYIGETLSQVRREAILAFAAYSSKKWKYLYRRGYRAVKVLINEA